MLQIDIKNCTEEEVKFALSSALFVWMKREDRIFGMMQLGNLWTVKQIVELIREIDVNADKWFEAQGIFIPKYLCVGEVLSV